MGPVQRFAIGKPIFLGGRISKGSNRRSPAKKCVAQRPSARVNYHSSLSDSDRLGLVVDTIQAAGPQAGRRQTAREPRPSDSALVFLSTPSALAWAKKIMPCPRPRAGTPNTASGLTRAAQSCREPRGRPWTQSRRRTARARVGCRRTRRRGPGTCVPPRTEASWPTGGHVSSPSRVRGAGGREADVGQNRLTMLGHAQPPGGPLTRLH